MTESSMSVILRSSTAWLSNSLVFYSTAKCRDCCLSISHPSILLFSQLRSHDFFSVPQCSHVDCSGDICISLFKTPFVSICPGFALNPRQVSSN